MVNETPDLEKRKAAVSAFEHFLEVIQTLRAPGGCPWDREQTPLSMRNNLIEETFEAVEAISEQDAEHSKEELGDVLLNTMMISYMFEQENKFTMAESIEMLTEKLIRRHPHVFPQCQGASQANQKAATTQEVLSQWEKIKQNVEGRKTESILDQVPKGFPPLLKACKMQKKASKKGFEWKTPEDAFKKVEEELEEVKNAGNHSDLEGEIGDLLFAVINYARMKGIDPETALNRTNSKFYNRFTYVESHMAQAEISMDKDHLSQQMDLWNEAKSQWK